MKRILFSVLSCFILVLSASVYADGNHSHGPDVSIEDREEETIKGVRYVVYRDHKDVGKKHVNDIGAQILLSDPTVVNVILRENQALILFSLKDGIIMEGEGNFHLKFTTIFVRESIVEGKVVYTGNFSDPILEQRIFENWKILPEGELPTQCKIDSVPGTIEI